MLTDNAAPCAPAACMVASSTALTASARSTDGSACQRTSASSSCTIGNGPTTGASADTGVGSAKWTERGRVDIVASLPAPDAERGHRTRAFGPLVTSHRPSNAPTIPQSNVTQSAPGVPRARGADSHHPASRVPGRVRAGRRQRHQLLQPARVPSRRRRGGPDRRRRHRRGVCPHGRPGLELRCAGDTRCGNRGARPRHPARHRPPLRRRRHRSPRRPRLPHPPARRSRPAGPNTM